MHNIQLTYHPVLRGYVIIDLDNPLKPGVGGYFKSYKQAADAVYKHYAKPIHIRYAELTNERIEA